MELFARALRWMHTDKSPHCPIADDRHELRLDHPAPESVSVFGTRMSDTL